MTPAVPGERGQQQLIPCAGVGQLQCHLRCWENRETPYGVTRGDPVRGMGTVPRLLLHQQGLHMTASKGGGKERKKGKKGLCVLWEQPEFLLLPRLLQRPFLWQGGTQHYLPESLLPSHLSPCPSLTCWFFSSAKF